MARKIKLDKDSMPCNKPRPARDGKHDKVVKACEGDQETIVRFGDASMKNHEDDAGRRKNFRSRHGCDNPGPKTKARYWSCKAW